MKKLAIIVFAVLALGACKKQEKKAESLPPASGEGSKPLPDIPDVQKGDAGVAAGSGSSAAPDSVVSGTLEPREQVNVGPKSSGTIVQILVDENSKVKKGDVLFRLDSRDAQLAKKQALNQLKAAQLQVKNLQREYDRLAGLVAQNAMPQQQLDQLGGQLDGAKLSVAAAKDSIAMSDKHISDATVRSPINGVVITKAMSVGEYATMMPPSLVLLIQDQSSLELKFNLPEKSLTSIKQGDPVTVTIASLGQTRAAKVSQISPMVDAKTRTVQVTAILDNCDGGLRPGVAAEVKLGAATDATTPECGNAPPPAAAKKAPMPVKPAKKAAPKGAKQP